MEDPFYIVVSGDRGPASYPAIHSSFDLAKSEASRLARMSPGTKFHVLVSCGHAIKHDVDWQDGRVLTEIKNSREPFPEGLEDEIPF